MTDQLHLWPDDQPGDRLKWSISRDKRLRDCRRKYYLQHFASLGGWAPAAPAAVRELHVLKNLQNRFMWVGSVVHEMIELALAAWRRGDSVPVGALVERGTRRMRAQYAESLQGVYRDRPARACGLVEHEYREEVSREIWKALRDQMEHCLRTFFDLDLTQRIRQTPPYRWLALESLASFDLDGTTVLVKPDFAWRDADGQVVLVDWKTGKPRAEQDWFQLAVYGLFARRTWGPGAGAIRGVVAFLDSGRVREMDLPAADLERAKEAIRESAGEMRRLAPADAQPDPAGFPMTGDTSRCRHCSFRRPCGRE